VLPSNSDGIGIISWGDWLWNGSISKTEGSFERKNN
jgi:hypothetical protein